jgi:hypothetical protein
LGKGKEGCLLTFFLGIHLDGHLMHDYKQGAFQSVYVAQR